MTLVYLVLGAILGFIYKLVWATRSWWHWGISMTVPAVFTVGLFGKDMGIPLQLAYVAVALVSASLGAFLGAFSRPSTKEQVHITEDGGDEGRER